MPMQVGEMMVVVRAQDFASRTLRRVSGELSGMSKQQRLAYMGQDAMFSKATATAKVAAAQSDLRRLNYIAETKRINEQVAALQRLQQADAALRIKGGTRFKKGSAFKTGDLAESQAAARAVQSLGLSTKSVSQQLDVLQPKATRMEATVNTMSSSFQRAFRSQTVWSNGMYKARQNLSSAYNELNKAQRAELAFNEALQRMPIQRMSDIGHAASGIGRTMQLFGAVGTVAFAATANAAANFNQQVTLAATQTRGVGQSFNVTAANADRLSKIILNLMTKFPASADDMSKAAYDIFSSIDTTFGGGAKLLTLFNKVAVAGGVDLATATQAGISVLENFDTKLRNTGKVTGATYDILNRMFAIVRFGRMNFSQFNDMLNSVVPAATGAKQSFDDISGAMAVLTRHIPSQSRAATSLARLLDVFTNKDFQDGMRKAGASITDFQKNLLPLPDIIDKIASMKPKELNNIIQQVTAFGRGSGRGREYTIQARRALTQLLSNLGEYHRVQGQVTGDNTEFNNSFKAMSQTLGVQWQVFLNQLKVLVLYIGQKALPVFLQIAHQVTGWIDHWKKLSDHTQGLIVKIGVLASVFTLLGGVIVAIGGTIATLTASFLLFKKSMGARGEAGTVIGQMDTLLLLGRALAGIGTIAIGIELIKKGDGWKTLGIALTAAGLIGGIRGFRAGGVAGTIVLGVELMQQGGGWKSKVGAALMGGAIGARYGPVGILVGAAGSAAIETRRQDAVVMNTYKKYKDLQDRIKGLSQRGAADVGKRANQILVDTYKKSGADAGIAAANSFLNNWHKKVVVQNKSMIGMGDFQASTAKSADKVHKSLLQQIHDAKTLTEVQAIVNRQMQDSASAAEVMANQIARAASSGNLKKAFDLLNKYVDQSNRKVTGKNVLDLIAQAFTSGGGAQEAAQILDQYAQNAQQYSQDVIQYQQQIAQRTKDLQQTISDATTSTLDSLTSLYSQLQQANESAFGQLLQGPKLSGDTGQLMQDWGITPAINDIIADLHGQNVQFAQWRKGVDVLFKKGVPKDFIDQIQALGPDQAGKIMNNLLKAKPGQIKTLIAEWKRHNREIQNATKTDFSRQIDSFKKAGISMAQAMKNGFQSEDVGTWFAKWVRQKFPNVINAAVAAAVKDFKKNNPLPKKPEDFKGPIGSTPKNPAGTAAGATHNTTNHKKDSHDIHVHLPPDYSSGGHGPHHRLKKRREAFQIAQGVKQVQIIHGD